MNKIVNLDDEKNSVTLIVEGREFVISRIVMKARQVYGEYLQDTGKYLQLVAEAQALDGKSADELEALNAKLEGAIEDYAKKKAAYIEELLEIILVKNGYEYDPEWWASNADYSAMEAFVYAALKKDEQDKPGKKKDEPSQ